MASPHILAVMGVTGAGKSSFIRLVTGDASIKIGHSQESETKIISCHNVNIGGKTFTLVDTPGFDDLYMKDSDVLNMLLSWLASTYRSGQKLSGILYLHRITEPRMRGSSLRNLNMFKELIGDDFHKNITLATTCWSLVPAQTALDREGELQTSSSFWKIMISKGARLDRIPDDSQRAQDLVYRIAQHTSLPLQAQCEMVDQGIAFNDLSVTRMVNSELDKLEREQAIEFERLGAEKRRLFAEQEQKQQEELEYVRARNQRAQELVSKANNCKLIRPYGRCDNSGCKNKLKRWKIVYHCCSCNPDDSYWHCGSCSNNCGNNDHPYMTAIDTSTIWNDWDKWDDWDNCIVI